MKNKLLFTVLSLCVVGVASASEKGKEESKKSTTASGSATASTSAAAATYSLMDKDADSYGNLFEAVLQGTSGTPEKLSIPVVYRDNTREVIDVAPQYKENGNVEILCKGRNFIYRKNVNNVFEYWQKEWAPTPIAFQ